MFYYLYEIRNTLNGKIYVGVHKTNDMNDGYMGSGKIIKRAIEKYGADNFIKVVLEYFDSSEAMYAREKEVVTHEFLCREDTYNLIRGGFGGFDYLNDSSPLHIERCKLGYTAANIDAKKVGSVGGKARFMKHGMPALFVEKGKTSFLGKEHSIETKRKIGDKNSLNQMGQRNSQFGTCWINHELIGCKKCKVSELPLYIEQGWFKGRKVYASFI